MKVPIEIVEGELGSAQYRIHCEFDSHGDWIQIDTGSTYTALRFNNHTEAYTAFGSKTRLSASGKPRSSDMIEIAKFKVGSITKLKFPVVRYESGSLEAARLGMDWFDASSLTFDLAAQPPSLFSGPEASDGNILHNYNGGTFGIDVTIGGNVVEALWDTGAELTVVDRDFIMSNGSFFEFEQKIENGQDAAGNSVEFDLYRVTNLEIGSIKFSGKIMSMDFGMISEKVGQNIKVVLGTNFMRGYIWQFDFSGRKWKIS
ncbi:MAG: hypothetical protein EOP06_04235 [Proteobacteria bacterium]|nr:MAG: hypothetical protein EOP06_04235 [Pseudomonadota bacterium]